MPHKRKERSTKREPLREKEDSQERVECGKENRKEKIEMRDQSETYTRYYN